MNTPTIVPLMVWVAYVVWGYVCMALCQCCIIACRYITVRYGRVILQVVVGVALLYATVCYNNSYNSGQLRLYILLGMLVGGAIYYLVCYRVVQMLVHRMAMRITNRTNK